MARWVDVRVPTAQQHRAYEALQTLAPLNFRLDLNPPAAGPEVEFQIEGRTELEVVGVLSRRGVTVLATRERIGEPMKALLGPPPAAHESLIAIIERSEKAPGGEALFTTTEPPSAWARFRRKLRRGA